MPEINHGIKVNELTTGVRPIKDSAAAVIGLVATATAAAGAATTALNAAFPLNKPVLVTSIRAALAAVAATTGGTLKPTLEAIADQTNPVLIVVRVAEGNDAAATNANVIGTVDNAGAYTGMQALLVAESETGVRPRIIGAPGLDTQPVTTALAIVARKLRGFAYAKAVGATVAAAITYRANFAAKELMLLFPDFAGPFAGDAVARALGLRARIDQEIGWHKSLSNVAVDGISGGLTLGIGFDLLGDDHAAGELNNADITTMVRNNGWRFWGNRTCSDEPLFAFETAVRSGQALQDEISNGLAWALDKPLTKVLVKDILETINARLRALVAQGRLIGGQAFYDPDLNPQDQLAAGKLVIDYEYTPCAPAENIVLNQRITDRFYASFADALAN